MCGRPTASQSPTSATATTASMTCAAVPRSSTPSSVPTVCARSFSPKSRTCPTVPLSLVPVPYARYHTTEHDQRDTRNEQPSPRSPERELDRQAQHERHRDATREHAEQERGSRADVGAPGVPVDEEQRADARGRRVDPTDRDRPDDHGPRVAEEGEHRRATEPEHPADAAAQVHVEQAARREVACEHDEAVRHLRVEPDEAVEHLVRRDRKRHEVVVERLEQARLSGRAALHDPDPLVVEEGRAAAGVDDEHGRDRQHDQRRRDGEPRARRAMLRVPARRWKRGGRGFGHPAFRSTRPGRDATPSEAGSPSTRIGVPLTSMWRDTRRARRRRGARHRRGSRGCGAAGPARPSSGSKTVTSAALPSASTPSVVEAEHARRAHRSACATARSRVSTSRSRTQLPSRSVGKHASHS